MQRVWMISSKRTLSASPMQPHPRESFSFFPTSWDAATPIRATLLEDELPGHLFSSEVVWLAEEAACRKPTTGCRSKLDR